MHINTQSSMGNRDTESSMGNRARERDGVWSTVASMHDGFRENP